MTCANGYGCVRNLNTRVRRDRTGAWEDVTRGFYRLVSAGSARNRNSRHMGTALVAGNSFTNRDVVSLAILVWNEYCERSSRFPANESIIEKHLCSRKRFCGGVLRRGTSLMECLSIGLVPRKGRSALREHFSYDKKTNWKQWGEV